MDARILERERAGRGGGGDAALFQGAGLDIESGVEAGDDAVANVVRDPAAACLQERLRPVVDEGIEGHVVRLEASAQADAGARLPDFAAEGEARTVGVEGERFERNA